MEYRSFIQSTFSTAKTLPQLPATLGVTPRPSSAFKVTNSCDRVRYHRLLMSAWLIVEASKAKGRLPIFFLTSLVRTCVSIK